MCQGVSVFCTRTALKPIRIAANMWEVRFVFVLETTKKYCSDMEGGCEGGGSRGESCCPYKTTDEDKENFVTYKCLLDSYYIFRSLKNKHLLTGCVGQNEENCTLARTLQPVN